MSEKDFVDVVVNTMTEHPVLVAGATLVADLVIAEILEYPRFREQEIGEERTRRDLEDRLRHQNEKRTALEKQLSKTKKDNEVFCTGSPHTYIDYLNQTNNNLEAIKKCRYDLFQPGCVEVIQGLVDKAKQHESKNVDMISIARLKSEEYLLELEKQEKEWWAVYDDIKETYLQIALQLEQCPQWKVSLPTAQGVIDYEMDVNFWSKGALDTLRESLPKDFPNQNTPASELDQFQSKLNESQNHLEALCNEAEKAFRNWHDRLTQCKVIFQTMRRRGWWVKKQGCYGYEDNDKRNTIFLKMDHPTNDWIEFRFPPNEGFRCLYHSRMPGNRSQLNDILMRIEEALLAEGYQIVRVENDQ